MPKKCNIREYDSPMTIAYDTQVDVVFNASMTVMKFARPGPLTLNDASLWFLAPVAWHTLPIAAKVYP